MDAQKIKENKQRGGGGSTIAAAEDESTRALFR